MAGSNDNDWESYYSDEDDYVENMNNLQIDRHGVKMKQGTKSKDFSGLPTPPSNVQSSLDGQIQVMDDPSLDESSIASYSIDYSMLSEMNDLSFLTNGKNLAALLNGDSCNHTLEDEINSAIDREALLNPDTSLIAKTFFNSNEETDLSTLLPSSIQGNTSLVTDETNDSTEVVTVNTESNLEGGPKVTENTESPLADEQKKEGENRQEGEENPMFIDRVSSIPIVQQSVQAIKSTSIGNFADRTLRRVASTRLPVISVPKLPTLPKIGRGQKEQEGENDSKEKDDSKAPQGMTLEDASKNLPGLSTINTIGNKTLDKLEENFPMINDPELLNKIRNRIEELREIGENTAVVQSSLNSLQNMQNRLNRYNSVIVRRTTAKDHTNTPLRHRHSFSAATTQTEEATTTFRNRHFTATSTIQRTTTSTAKASFETQGCCCCHCHCHDGQSMGMTTPSLSHHKQCKGS